MQQYQQIQRTADGLHSAPTRIPSPCTTARAPAFSPYAPYVRFSLDGCAILWPGESPSPAVRSPMR